MFALRVCIIQTNVRKVNTLDKNILMEKKKNCAIIKLVCNVHDFNMEMLDVFRFRIGEKMTDSIKNIYEMNKILLGDIDRAVFYFRICSYENALEIVGRTGECIKLLAEAVLVEREYFKDITAEAVSDMLRSILEASRTGNYVLLADIYELQLANFICSIQETILKTEQYLIYDETRYRENISALKNVLREMIEEREDLSVDEQKRFRVNLNASLDEPFDAEGMLKKGYMLEFTAGGLMTVAAPYKQGRIYLHSNGHVEQEAFLQAESWYNPAAEEYVVYGLGLGYHIEQLHALAPQKRIVVYEGDLDMFRLYCAFGGECRILNEENVFMVYDEKLNIVERRLQRCSLPNNENMQLLYDDASDTIVKACIHYPSYRRTQGCGMLDSLVPWKAKIEALT